MMSYPEERNKGLYISIFWCIFNLGAIIGSIVSLALNWHNQEPHVSNQTYYAFMGTMAVGCLLTFALLPPNRIRRADGSQVAAEIQLQSTSCSAACTEAMSILKLFKDWRLLCLIPMFVSSNWFYTYQFNVVNGGGMFTTRTRALNGTLYWIAQLVGAILMGQLLDYQHAERKKRAMVGLGFLFMVTMAIWGGGYAFQETYTRTSVKVLTASEKIDFENGTR